MMSRHTGALFQEEAALSKLPLCHTAFPFGMAFSAWTRGFQNPAVR
jgi:hypothetical protein